MSNTNWSLEVVRGREAGRVYALGRGETVIGNDLNGTPGLDLGHQEGDSPRRMAPRQARLDVSPAGVQLIDLDSPGGTFVNRQRILPGQSRVLQPGDVIQLGSVQLKVVAAPLNGTGGTGGRTAAAAPARPEPTGKAPPPAPGSTAPGQLPAPFIMASGTTCRTWDDFLTVSAQRWAALREELTSGRLGGFLASIQRSSLVPAPNAPGTPDERLDAWLAGLPTNRPSRPELEVHPETLTVRAVPGGGVTRQTIRLTNVGYRLLRSTFRVDAGWIQLAPEFSRQPVVTVDQTEVPLEIRIPESLDSPLTGQVTIESNGGTRRVEVRIERPPAPAFDEPGPAAPATAGTPFSHLVARQSFGQRLVFWPAGAVLLRLLVMVGSLVPGSRAADGEIGPRLLGPAVVFGLAGALVAAFLGSNRGEARDIPAAGFAGGCAAVFASTVLVALARAVEPLLGTSLAGSPIAVIVVWALLGLAAAAASTRIVPPRAEPEVQS
jgi:hypothetical protein